jgi:hypothetical protein
VIFYGVDEILPLLEQADELVDSLTESELREALAPTRWFLEQAAESPGIRLAQSGRLGRKFVQAGDERFQFSNLGAIGHKAQNEDDVLPLVELRKVLRALRIVRTYKGHLVATAAGKKVLAGTHDLETLRDLFLRACANICREDAFESELTSLLLVLLIDVGPDGVDGSSLYGELESILAQRWNIDRRGIAYNAAAARSRLKALGLISEVERFHIVLTFPAGLAGATLALKARLETASEPSSEQAASPLIEWAIAHGIDPTDQTSLDEAVDRFNALSFEERSRILGYQ